MSREEWLKSLTIGSKVSLDSKYGVFEVSSDFGELIEVKLGTLNLLYRRSTGEGYEDYGDNSNARLEAPSPERLEESLAYNAMIALLQWASNTPRYLEGPRQPSSSYQKVLDFIKRESL